MFKPVLIVPYYNHLKEFESFAPQLANLKKDVIFINDGSEKEQTEQVKKICQQYHFFYIEHPVNQGKGAAVKTGIKTAFKQGYTHALQIDSDGQHNINDVDLFLSVAQKNQQSIVNGSPVYDDTAPKSRLIGRKITNFWVAVETGSKKKIADAMCGFRVYPIKKTFALLPYLKFNRMGFDIEILVKAALFKFDICNQPTKVIYHKSGTSHFHTFRDNVLISCLHTYLCFWAFLHLFWKGKKDVFQL